ncbi:MULTISPECIES: sel1 repeat family protein [Stenotrophomonas]|uniref:sel1 repeat family protein n=1 Tax=Stenotrophomonas TaxID=40323 RepID=UPI0011B42714|nr:MULTISPECIES: sel1 repeat family protein [Stenotrophomonas]MDH1660554.1 sel1 repeat family protein [Stenotrophomonas sp. GD03777]
MNRKNVSITALALLIATTAAIAIMLGNDSSSAKNAATEIANANIDSDAGVKPTPYVQLAAQRKIDSRYVTAANGRAFTLQRPPIFRPPGDALAFANGLLAASRRGDATSTYEIFLTVSDCQNAMEGAPPIASNEPEMREFSRQEIDYFKTKLTECESLLGDPSFTSKNWLDLAAEQGSIEAKIMYSINPDHILGNVDDYSMKPEKVSEWKEKSIQYLEEASKQGSTNALFQLSNIYENGIVASADPIKSLAYQIAYDNAKLGNPNNQRQLDLRRSLTREQQNRAEQLSKEIFKSCCTN